MEFYSHEEKMKLIFKLEKTSIHVSKTNKGNRFVEIVCQIFLPDCICLCLVDLVGVSWHGAVIDTELDTDNTKVGQNKEDSLSNQEAKLSRGSGMSSRSRLERVLTWRLALMLRVLQEPDWKPFEKPSDMRGKVTKTTLGVTMSCGPSPSPTASGSVWG